MRLRTAVAIWLLVINAGVSPAQQARTVHRALDDFSAGIEAVAKTARPGVVDIAVSLRAAAEGTLGRKAGFLVEQEAHGSGAIIDPDGYILTNAHVVNGARKIEVGIYGSDGKDGTRTLRAKLIGLDRDLDLAVIKVEATGLPALTFVDSDTLKQGQFVMALGSPLGLENTLTVGIVSAVRRFLKPEDPMWYVQTDAPINPGNSGGALLDAAGRLAGINTLILSQSGGSEGIGFAIPANTAKRVYELIRRDGRVKRGAIGVIPQTVTSTLAKALALPVENGVILSDVLPQGGASAAGLEPGDVIVAAEGQPVKQSRDLASVIYQKAAGESISLEVLRGGGKLSKRVVVTERPGEPERLEEIAAVNGSLIRRLGALVLPLDEKVAPLLPEIRRLYGVVVGAVPAEFAGRNPGLIAGDVIYSVNGRKVETILQLVDEMYARKAGDSIALQVERSRELIYVAFELE